MWKSAVGFLRGIGIVEGISYLILLFIAMPLKYFAGLPEMVRIVGMAHGVLFALFMVLLLIVWIQHRWSFVRVIGAFIAVLLPFGTFVLEAKLRKTET